MKYFVRAAASIAVAASALLALSVSAQTVAPSRFGPNDEIGNANLLTPALAAAAAKLVTTGKVYELGIHVTPDTPAYPPRGCKLIIVQPGQVGGAGALGPTKTTYNDDILNCWIGIGSQLDGLGHIGVDNVYFNGNLAKDFAQTTGLTKLGIEKVPAMVTRGVLLDMAAHYGVDIVKEGTAFNQAEIDAVAKKQGVEIRQGDVVIFHTGWLSLISSDAKRYSSGEPGLGKNGAQYLASKRVVAVGADTWGLDAIPFEPGVGVFEVHQILLPLNGIYILENMSTAALAKDKVYEFMFVLGHSKYKGAVQSMINPVAIK
jgi:kynurenine formamidase